MFRIGGVGYSKPLWTIRNFIDAQGEIRALGKNIFPFRQACFLFTVTAWRSIRQHDKRNRVNGTDVRT